MLTIAVSMAILWSVVALSMLVLAIMLMYEVTYTNRMARKVKRAKLKEYMKSRKK